MTRLAGITIYPVKSLDGVEVDRAAVLASGALANDRRYALVDDHGHAVNAKRFAAMQRIRTRFADDFATVLVTDAAGDTGQFSLSRERREFAAWISARVETACSLVENSTHGFPDDAEAPGPTLISTATLAAIAAWFGLSVDEARRRFRTNLEIDAPHAFWEDQLAAVSEFRLGDVAFRGERICQRCVVPSRDSLSGEPLAGFQKRFAVQREGHLPSASPRAAFDHFYRLAINTSLVGLPGVLAVGDALSRDVGRQYYQ